MNRTKMPMTNPRSPVFVVINALIAASEFSFSSNQCPMSRYEQIPTSSHPTSNRTVLLAMTRVSIDPVKRFSAA
jgi:hypothetical protein